MNNKIIQTDNKKLICNQFSHRTMELLVKTNRSWDESDELSVSIRKLIPQGNPDLSFIMQFKPIKNLIKEQGMDIVKKMIAAIVVNFGNSLNVVRPMGNEQVREIAAFLIDECMDYRVEDYISMFAMAKRGQIGKILDRVDIQVIGKILEEYDAIRESEKERLRKQKITDADKPPIKYRMRVIPWKIIWMGNEHFKGLCCPQNYYWVTNDWIPARDEFLKHYIPFVKESGNFNKAVREFKEYVQKSEEKRQQKIELEKEEFDIKKRKMLADFEHYKKDHGLPDDTPMIDLGFKNDKNVKA